MNNIKLVVASMSVLGLISCPAIAAAQTQHKHHHVVKKQAAVQTVDYKGDYKGAIVDVCPINDPITLTLEGMDQNLGRAKPTVGCMNPIAFAGGINFDAKWGNRSMGYQGENTQRLSLNDAYLNIFGNVSDWAKGFASISYNDASGINGSAFQAGQYSNVYPTNTLTLEQGFIRIADFNQYPVFFQIGKQYQDFGRYMIHPITRSMTQVLTETLRTSAELGFVTGMGFHGDIYAFDNAIPGRSIAPLTTGAGASTVQGHNHTVYGAALGFDHPSDQLGYAVNVAYLSNMTAVNDITQAISQYQSLGTGGGSYHGATSGVAVDGMINSGPFSLIADYVTATSRFNPLDLGNQGANVVVPGTGKGAKPSAGNIQAGYNFNGWSRNQNIYLGYQASGDAVAIHLPKSRWVAGWNVDAWKFTNIGIQWDHDNDYSVTQGGTGNSSNLVSVRGAVKFG